MSTKNNSNKAEFSVRKCSFNPSDYCIEIDSMRGDDSKQMYLEVKFRVLWFLTYCAENGLTGVIDESRIVYIPETKMFQATATVSINGEVVGTGIAGKSYVYDDDRCSQTVIQDVATTAKGRALANAGFGTAMCAFEDGEPTPCDAGIQRFKNPLIPEKKETEIKPVTEKRTTNESDNTIPKTIEEARAVTLHSGQYQGRTIGELAALDLNYVKFLASKYSVPSHPEYPAAAKILLAEIA